MSGLKGWGLLLVLGIPLVLFCALQAKGVFRTDMIASDPPADRGATQEQLTAAHTKSSAWLGEVRKANAMACQFRAAKTEEGSTDQAVKDVVTTAAARSADLTDLDLFLSEIDRPDFTGNAGLRKQYQDWMDERKKLKSDETAIVNWLGSPPKITSAADATKAMDEFVTKFINLYAKRSGFSDNAKATAWRIRGRLILIDALTTLSDSQYRDAVKVSLPLESGNNAVKTAVDTLRGLKTQIDALNAEAKQAVEDKVRLDAAAQTAIEAKGAVADECVAREQLLALFAKEDLFSNALGATKWLQDVAKQYRKTKDEAVRALIRDKVQEFCDAFIPKTVRLDDKVILVGETRVTADRKLAIIKYQEKLGGEVKRKPLGDLDGVNEFNLAEVHPGESTFVEYLGKDYRQYKDEVRPTDLSKAAVMFNRERKLLSDATTQPKWNAKSLEALKNKCEPQEKLVEQLQVPGTGSVGKELKLWTRLTALALGMVGNADLFASP